MKRDHAPMVTDSPWNVNAQHVSTDKSRQMTRRWAPWAYTENGTLACKRKETATGTWYNMESLGNHVKIKYPCPWKPAIMWNTEAWSQRQKEWQSWGLGRGTHFQFHLQDGWATMWTLAKQVPKNRLNVTNSQFTTPQNVSFCLLSLHWYGSLEIPKSPSYKIFQKW